MKEGIIKLGKRNTLFDMSELHSRCRKELGHIPKLGFGVKRGENFVNFGGEKLPRAELLSLGFYAAATGQNYE